MGRAIQMQIHRGLCSGVFADGHLALDARLDQIS